MSAASKPVTILVVDDDPGLGRLIERELRREGYQTATAISGKEAMAWLEKGQADMLLLDFKLPDVNAPDFIRMMRGAGREIPFIIITGQGDERVAVDMMKRGALDYLIKDVNFIEFIPTVVRRALSQMERERKLESAERNLRQQAELLQLSHDAIFVWSVGKGIEFWNASAAKLYGHRSEDALGRDPRELLQTRYPCPWEEVETALHEQGSWEGEIRQTARGGAELIVSSRLQLMGGAEKAMTILVTNRDITESRRLEEALIGAIEDEQRRIGRDLHDGLGQELTAIGMLNSVVHKGLEAKGHAEAKTLATLGELLKRAGTEVRRISHGLQPVASEPGALMAGLKQLVAETVALHRVHAAFECPKSVEIADPGVANHLYRIAQEAVQNALRHGKPRNLVVRLVEDGPRVGLEIEDDGLGISKERVDNASGIGLGTMKYRANAMGGFLQVLRPAKGGTLIRCLATVAQALPREGQRERRRPAP